MSGHLQSGAYPIRAELLHGTFPSVAHSTLAAPTWEEHHEKAWRGLCDANQRLHDGPIWAVSEATAARIAVRKGRYRELAVQDHPAIGDMGVRQLGVKGVSVAMGAGGEPCILIARRGWRVRTYANMWETAPAGGVGAHEPLSEAAASHALAEEARQELGINADPTIASLRFVAVLHDATARSVELVATLPWPGPIDPHWSLPAEREEAWEYSAARWLPLSEVPTFLAATSAGELTPPARWILENARTLLT